MDFAKKQLEKYGWAEGKGLGKNENGMQSALKTKPKCGLSGIGHNIADEFTNQWWHRVYDNATNNVEISIKENGEVSKFSTKDEESSSEIKDKTILKKKKMKPAYFNNFVKCATLSNEKYVEVEQKDVSDTVMDNNNESDVTIPKLTDEELFAACGGRTAHKGARHGLKSSGKLARIEYQEKLLMKKHGTKKTRNRKQRDDQ